MNILHMKYAVEVARCGSINKAAEKLYIAQPNLSRCIKELENDLGIAVFDRSSRGMKLTPQGKAFIQYAGRILDQIDDLERLYKETSPLCQHFSISVPRASYISDAFVHFTRTINQNPAEIYYMETNSSRTITNVLKKDYHLGIIRYASNYDRYFKEMLEEKGLAYELVAEFQYILLMSTENALACKDTIFAADLKDLIEIVHGDPYVPSLPIDALRKEELQEGINRQIFLFERGAQFDLLAENLETFMWVSPVPDNILKRYSLIQRECSSTSKQYRDVLIRKKDYLLTETDRTFISELFRSKRRWLP